MFKPDPDKMEAAIREFLRVHQDEYDGEPMSFEMHMALGKLSVSIEQPRPPRPAMTTCERIAASGNLYGDE